MYKHIYIYALIMLLLTRSDMTCHVFVAFLRQPIAPASFNKPFRRSQSRLVYQPGEGCKSRIHRSSQWPGSAHKKSCFPPNIGTFTRYLLGKLFYQLRVKSKVNPNEVQVMLGVIGSAGGRETGHQHAPTEVAGPSFLVVNLSRPW
jgi:hypothetical protein